MFSLRIWVCLGTGVVCSFSRSGSVWVHVWCVLFQDLGILVHAWHVPFRDLHLSGYRCGMFSFSIWVCLGTGVTCSLSGSGSFLVQDSVMCFLSGSGSVWVQVWRVANSQQTPTSVCNGRGHLSPHTSSYATTSWAHSL